MSIHRFMSILLGGKWPKKDGKYQPVAIPNFHGLTTKHPNTFYFEFEVVCRTDDYILDAQNLKLFHSTLKHSMLRWFMILEGDRI